MLTADVRRVAKRTLLATARSHAVVTDRTLAEGGDDLGFTSGEMLLLAIGSCALSSANEYLLGLGYDALVSRARVLADPPTADGGFGDITVLLDLGEHDSRIDKDALLAAAGSGRVTRRVASGSRVEFRAAERDVRACLSPEHAQ
ncbi:MAG: hypothetical protein HY056_04065 [Proteobacteria bacterium]|nr:hypothetical protein [Pseudomonadota bacterium]